MEVKWTIDFCLSRSHRYNRQSQIETPRRDWNATGETKTHLRRNVFQRQQLMRVLQFTFGRHNQLAS